jgi:hypothetical protein
MTQTTLNALMIMSWVAMLILTALFIGVDSTIGWTVIAGASVLPPLTMLWVWRDPRRTVAESIRQPLQ